MENTLRTYSTDWISATENRATSAAYPSGVTIVLWALGLLVLALLVALTVSDERVMDDIRAQRTPPVAAATRAEAHLHQVFDELRLHFHATVSSEATHSGAID